MRTSTSCDEAQPRPLFEAILVKRATRDALRKLNPLHQLKNPVMFTVWVGSVLTTLLYVQALLGHGEARPGFILAIALWLWFTLLFANFAEAMAEGRGKAQADSLRRTKKDVIAKLLRQGKRGAASEAIEASRLRIGDVVLVEAGDTIPGDGEVIDGVASVNESAITGESAPVIRESGGDRSAVTGGTLVLSDWLVVRIVSSPGESFIDRMIAMVEGAKRQKTPNEIALDILLAALTIIFLLATATLLPYSTFAVKASGQGSPVTLTVLVALLVCLIPTTIGALLSAIGIAGMDRMVQANVIATSGRAVEAAGDVDVLLLDKTGTITLGNRQAVAFVPAPGVTIPLLADAAQLSSLADETPEGRSIVVLAKEQYDLRERDIHAMGAKFIPFRAQTRMSGVDLEGREIRKGAVSAIEDYVQGKGGVFPEGLRIEVDRIAREGGTPLVVAEYCVERISEGGSTTLGDGGSRGGGSSTASCGEREGGPMDRTSAGAEAARPGGPPARALGVIHLKDIVKGGIKERFAELRQMGIKTVMITGDNPLTAAAIAAEAGVDDFMAQATPEAKLRLIRDYQAGGRLVAMTGDGTNDAPALAQADVAVVMNSGTQAAKEAGNMVDLDSNPTKLIEIVRIGKQMLMTRGSLTTFSIANDVAKYFAIIPAAFAVTYPQLGVLNVMHLHSPDSAILSAVIFNALVIVFLIPLALKGVKYRPLGAAALLQRNLLLYGLGGILVPFAGIKAIDLILVALHLV